MPKAAKELTISRRSNGYYRVDGIEVAVARDRPDLAPEPRGGANRIPRRLGIGGAPGARSCRRRQRDERQPRAWRQVSVDRLDVLTHHL
jgi:hypothetical protein